MMRASAMCLLLTACVTASVSTVQPEHVPVVRAPERPLPIPPRFVSPDTADHAAASARAYRYISSPAPDPAIMRELRERGAAVRVSHGDAKKARLREFLACLDAHDIH